MERARKKESKRQRDDHSLYRSHKVGERGEREEETNIGERTNRESWKSK